MSKKKQEYRPPGAAVPSKPENQPQAPKAPKAAKPKRPTSGAPWHPAVRGFLSVAIALHLLAVFAAPWDLSTEAALPPGFIPRIGANGRPQPPAIDDPVWQQPVVPRALRRFFHNYLNLTYLNQGYQFFAPDPAGTHVIDYEVTQPDGTVVKGRFPDLEEQWPRLLYHRHMMLAEQTEMMGPDSARQYSNYLIRQHGGHCQMKWLIHLLLSPAEVEAGTLLTDPKTYIVLGTFDSKTVGEEVIAIPGGVQ